MSACMHPVSPRVCHWSPTSKRYVTRYQRASSISHLRTTCFAHLQVGAVTCRLMPSPYRRCLVECVHHSPSTTASILEDRLPISSARKPTAQAKKHLLSDGTQLVQKKFWRLEKNRFNLTSLRVRNCLSHFHFVVFLFSIMPRCSNAVLGGEMKTLT
ncbi:hypothetical protein BGY98DRAFT_1041334, partial [Russula aff. rugulosa BPL654]